MNEYQDLMKEKLNIEIGLISPFGNEILSHRNSINQLPPNSLKKFITSVKIPEDAIKGRYAVRLILKEKDGQILHKNDYSLFIMPREEFLRKIETTKQILIFTEKEKKKMGITDVLNELSIKHDNSDISQLGDMKAQQLRKYDLIIIGERALSDDITTNGDKIMDYVKQGGRLLCLEQRRNLFRDWLPQVLTWNEGWKEGEPDRRRKSYANSFVDIRRPEHPLFKGLDWKNFDTWNDYRGVIAYGLLFPLPEHKETILATGVSNSGSYEGALILNFRHGKGEYLLSQLEVVKRWGKDPVATKYLENLLLYQLASMPVTEATLVSESLKSGSGPFSTDKDGFIRNWLVCGPFPNPGGAQQLGFNIDYFLRKEGGFFVDGEKELTPISGMCYEVTFPKTEEGYWGLTKDEKVKCQWKRYVSSKPYNNLVGWFPWSDNVVAYAACYVDSPREMEAKIKIGHNDGYKLWLNHEFIGEDITCVAGLDSAIHRVNLKKGTNLVLLKICNNYGGWGYYLRFTDIDDKPLTDLKIWLTSNK